jgi:hypothetical protein
MGTGIYVPGEAEVGMFREERETLQEHQEEVLKHPGKWILVKGEVIVGYYESESAALTEGFIRFGVDGSFLARAVDELTRPPERVSSRILLPLLTEEMAAC